MPKMNKLIGFMGGKVVAPSNHHNFKKSFAVKICLSDWWLFLTMPVSLGQAISKWNLLFSKRYQRGDSLTWSTNPPSASVLTKWCWYKKNYFCSPSASYTTPKTGLIYQETINQTWRWTSNWKNQEWSKNKTREEQRYEFEWSLVATDSLLDSSTRPLSASCSMPCKQMVSIITDCYLIYQWWNKVLSYF